MKRRIRCFLLVLFLFLLAGNQLNLTASTSTSKLNKSKATLIKGQTTTLKLSNNTKKISWTSNNKTVATVSSKGLVTAKAKGQAKILAKVGSKTYTCTVNVITPSLNTSSAKIFVGNTTSLYFKGTSITPVWSSANPKIATVTTKGKVTGVKSGTTTITGKILGKAYTCKVTVSSSAVKITTPPAYTGKPYVALNNNKPNFTASQKTNRTAFEIYSNLDVHGRTQTAYANICLKLMPTKPREDISQIHPSGWHSKMGWERCHLIGFQLAGENANAKNLMTGTHYFNVSGMLPFENMIDDYIESHLSNHVLYRVTPVYVGSNLIANGVRMEAWSVEDQGAGICFNVYVYNVQPGKNIDYKSGIVTDNAKDPSTDPSESYTYVLNTNTMKFHYSSCSSVNQMSENNKSYFKGTREQAIKNGYSPCGNCQP